MEDGGARMGLIAFTFGRVSSVPMMRFKTAWGALKCPLIGLVKSLFLPD